MTTKEWLMRAWRIDGLINDLIRERDRARQSLSLQGVQTERERVQGGSKRMEAEWIDRCIDYERQLDQRIDEYYRIKMEIEDAISGVENNDLKRLLVLRYLECSSWDDIADQMYYSKVWVCTALHQRALKEIEKQGISFVSTKLAAEKD